MKTLFLILLFTATALPAQVAELTLLDASTKQPISNVEAYYARSLNGTITNERACIIGFNIGYGLLCRGIKQGEFGYLGG